MKHLNKELVEARIARLKTNAIENDKLIKKWQRKLRKY